MPLFLLTNIVVVILIGFLFVILSWIWPPDSPWAPWWSTSKKTAAAIGKLAKITGKDCIYELGCGEATALITLCQKFGADGVGIEIDPLRYWIATVKCWLFHLSTITILRKNFFDVDLSTATVVFVYLVPKALNRLLPKFQKELKPGTRIVSYRYEMNLPLISHDIENELRLYEIPQKKHK